MFLLEGFGSLLLLLSQGGGVWEEAKPSSRSHLEPRAEEEAEPPEEHERHSRAMLAQQAAFVACLLSMLLLPFMRMVRQTRTHATDALPPFCCLQKRPSRQHRR